MKNLSISEKAEKIAVIRQREKEIKKERALDEVLNALELYRTAVCEGSPKVTYRVEGGRYFMRKEGKKEREIGGLIELKAEHRILLDKNPNYHLKNPYSK